MNPTDIARAIRRISKVVQNYFKDPSEYGKKSMGGPPSVTNKESFTRKESQRIK